MLIRDVEVERPHLKRWLKQAQLQRDIVQAAERHDPDDLAKAIYSYLNFFVEHDWENATWFEVLEALAQLTNLCASKIDFPIFYSKEKNEQIFADYSEKEWYFWLHFLCSLYHWTIEYVQELEIEDAFGLLQEGLIEKQREREWQWSLTEFAYKYDEASKTSAYQPLPKPDWMTILKGVEPKKVMIRKDAIPAGVIDLGALYADTEKSS